MNQFQQYIADTDILMSVYRQKRQPTLFELARERYGTPEVSAITIYGIELGSYRAGRTGDYDAFFAVLRIIPVSLEVLLKTAELEDWLIRRNVHVGLPDTIIAATAVYHKLPLLTNNLRHFSRITPFGLELLDVPDR